MGLKELKKLKELLDELYECGEACADGGSEHYLGRPAEEIRAEIYALVLGG